MPHSQLILTLQSIRGIIDNFDALHRDLRKVRFDASTAVVSQPHLEDGKKGEEFKVEVKIKNNTAETSFPSGFTIHVNPVVGWEYHVELAAHLDVVLQGSTLCFTVRIPGLAAAAEELLGEEASYLRTELGDKFGVYESY